MLGAFSRWLALGCSSLPHGGWACLFGCFLFATCLCTADGVMAPSATHIVALGGYSDDVGLASMGFDGRRSFFGLAFVGVIPTFSFAF